MINAMIDTWSSFALSPWNVGPFGFGAVQAPAKLGERGQFIDEYFDDGGASLRYKLFIPSKYNGAPLPLIVMLHGCGQDAGDFAAGTGMNELAEKFSCFVAYPEQSGSANSQRCWNWFETAHHGRDRGEPALLAGVTRQIINSYAVDENRVYVAGLSSGGAMAVILGRTYPDLFAAVGCHSGLAHGSARDRYGAMLAMRDGVNLDALASHAGASVPIIVFHGDMDSTVHMANGVGVVQQSIHSYASQEARAHAELRMVEESGQHRGRRFTRSLHLGRAGKVVAEHWTVHGTGHAWSGGQGRGSFTDTSGPDASREMLRFFIGR